MPEPLPAVSADRPLRVLFVCLGNICRSPTGEGVLRAMAREEGLADLLEIDSAGTGDWHVGRPPDRRATAAAAGRGIALEGSARQVSRQDFTDFDLLLAADRANVADLQAIAPPETARKIVLLRSFDPAAASTDRLDVPDPYSGGAQGFEEVLDLVDAACRGLLDRVRSAAAAATAT